MPYTSTFQLKHMIDKKSGLQPVLIQMIATAPSPFAILDSKGNHLLFADTDVLVECDFVVLVRAHAADIL